VGADPQQRHGDRDRRGVHAASRPAAPRARGSAAG
jgi:hypothetical protein